MSYEKIVKKAIKGNDPAFQELIEFEKTKLYKMAYLYVRNERDALEIIHETIYKAYVSIEKLKNPAYFSTWLTRILINSAMDYIKKQNRVVPINQEMMSELHGVANTSVEERLDLLHAVEGLEGKYKTVIILRYYKDYSVKQISEILDCPEGTVKTMIHRAVRKLKVNLEGECINE